MLAIRGAACGDRDARDARIERQPAEIAAERGDALGVIERAERLQQPVTLGDVTAFRRIEPGEIVCRITPARFERRISGSVNAGRVSKFG